MQLQEIEATVPVEVLEHLQIDIVPIQEHTVLMGLLPMEVAEHTEVATPPGAVLVTVLEPEALEVIKVELHPEARIADLAVVPEVAEATEVQVEAGTIEVPVAEALEVEVTEVLGAEAQEVQEALEVLVEVVPQQAGPLEVEVVEEDDKFPITLSTNKN